VEGLTVGPTAAEAAANAVASAVDVDDDDDDDDDDDAAVKVRARIAGRTSVGNLHLLKCLSPVRGVLKWRPKNTVSFKMMAMTSTAGFFKSTFQDGNTAPTPWPIFRATSWELKLWLPPRTHRPANEGGASSSLSVVPMCARHVRSAEIQSARRSSSGINSSSAWSASLTVRDPPLVAVGRVAEWAR
jgi:hypothetical protein